MGAELSPVRLRLARLTQRQLARLAGVSEPHASLALRGRRPPGPRLLRAWSEHVEPRIEATLAREHARLRTTALMERFAAAPAAPLVKVLARLCPEAKR